MFTFNFNGQNFEKIRVQLQLMEYQSMANEIIESFDYGDIKKATKYAVENTKKVDGLSVEEKILVIDELFKKTIGWLKEHGKRV